jgi:hypothetical protein
MNTDPKPWLRLTLLSYDSPKIDIHCKMNYELFAGNIYHTLFTAQDAEDRCYADSFAELQVV